MRLTLHQTRDTVVEPTEHVLRIAGMFGLGIDDRQILTVVPPTTLDLAPGRVVFMTGPSGGGKSTLLRLIHEAAGSRARVIRFDRMPDPPDTPLVDAFPGLSLDRVGALLGWAGLGDAFVMLRRPRELSDGQRYRLRLARAMAEVETNPAGRPEQITIILADELGATLDRVTARVVARNIRRWVSRCDAPVCFVAATTHDDLLDALDPDLLIEKGLGDAIEVVERAPASPHTGPDSLERSRPDTLDEPLRLVRGDAGDYRALASFHYRAQRPATMTRVLALRHDRPTAVGRYLDRRGERQTVGVLVESLPTLSCAMRDAALHNRYRPLPPRPRAALLNDELRCISRVIVHPQWRGLGLAVRLVRAALDDSATRYTEALASMGRVHPFFERAGMTAYPRPPLPADARLTTALERAGLRPIDLASIQGTHQRIEKMSPVDHDWLMRELRHWHRNRHRSNLAEGNLDTLLRAAQQRLAFEPLYYLHDNGKTKP